MKVDSIETIIVDIPLRRHQRFSALGAQHQSSVLVLLRSEAGLVGLGEAVTPCGPWWSGESVESIKVTIDTYLAPIVVGTDPRAMPLTLQAMDRAVYGNSFAKAAIEMALLDLLGKAVGCGVSTLLGGVARESLPITWPLATGDAGRDVDEARDMAERGLAFAFKIKMGAIPPTEDLEQVQAIARGLEGVGGIRVDPNEAWDEMTARRLLPQLEAAGVDLIEQPVPRWHREAMSRLTGCATVPLMADEGVRSPQDMLETAKHGAASAVSLKIMKSGGLLASRRVAAIAEAAGIPVYIGTFLETGIGTAANMHLAATFSNLPYGGESIGPLLMTEDICTQPPDYRDGALWLRDGPGLGVELDMDRVAHFRRDRDRRRHSIGPDAGLARAR